MSEDQAGYVTDALEMMGAGYARQVETEVSGWIPVFNVVADFYDDHMTALVFGRMWNYCGMSDGVCKAGLERLATDLKISRATVIRHIEKLCADGFMVDLTPDRRNRPHEYKDGGKVVMKGSLSAVGVSQKNSGVSQKNTRVSERYLIKQDNTKLNNNDLTEEEKEQVNAKVNAIIASSKSQLWQGRELLRDNLLVLADWYNKTTGQEMTKRVQKTWYKALQDWSDEGIQPEHLQIAYDAQSKWRVVNDPNQLTKDACAIKASGAKSSTILPVTYNTEGMPESW